MRRWANLALLVLLAGAFLSGWLAFAFGTAPARWSLIAHIVSGFAIVALTPWKSVVVQRGLRRQIPGWWASTTFSLLVLVSVVAGVLHSTGLLRSAGDFSAIAVHVGAAIAAVPFGIWHVLARWIPPRATDLSRRSLLRTGMVLGSAALAYAASEVVVRITSLPGARRRFTGSYEAASFQPDSMPVTQWLFDRVPSVDAGSWRLTVRTAGGVRQWTLGELSAFDDRLTAVLDCTGGFYTEQRWSGAWLSRLIPEPFDALSVRVRSQTGYDRRFPIHELPRLLLATRLGDQPLPAGNGFPTRLVAADRRGFWWVKWVNLIEADGTPAWYQLPFPVQ